jgi:sugar phosphate isomerase/epimerase
MQDADVGDGVQDVARILKACQESGVKWVIVEHMEKDVYEDSIASVQNSLQNIQKAMAAL